MSIDFGTLPTNTKAFINCEKHISERHRKAIIYAVNKIINSELSSYIDKIILYGSCARGEAKYGSDVDLCVILKEGSNQELKISSGIHRVKGTVSSDKVGDAEADVKFFIGRDWEKNNSLFCRNIRKDGKVIYGNE